MNDRPHENRLSDDRGLKMRMRSEERRIASQHVQLGDLFSRLMSTLRRGGSRRAMSDFLHFETALQAHMSMEEEIYFPALHGLRNDAAEELDGLAAEHRQIRERLSSCRICLAAEDEDDSGRELHLLADCIDGHEQREEDLLARITEGPVARLSGALPEDSSS